MELHVVMKGPADGSYDRLVIDWQNSCRHKNVKLRIKQAAAT